MELRDEVESKGSKFALLILTDPVQMNDIDQPDMDKTKSNHILSELLIQEEIVHLDLYPEMLAYQQEYGAPLHLPKDGHWTKKAHRVVGERLANGWVRKS